MAKARKSKAGEPPEGFSDEERAAMQERAKELKAAKRRSSKADGEADVLTQIAAMAEDDRAIAERLHALMKEIAPELSPKTWYGMPAYARDGKVICFFQAASKFKTRFATLGFSEHAKLDDGTMWPTAFAITRLSDQEAKQITALVQRALG
jgi:uncharacterized protein YdhG (YjbR/CyaY superfamily)